MTESRHDLLSWLNNLLALNYTKVEQCGSGAAFCQIVDSIYGDTPMSKVKFDAKHEFEFVQNYKILQRAFDNHSISHAIPVERLVKCKFQENIEFLQMVKKYWDSQFPGGNYDAVGRRGGKSFAAVPRSASAAPIRKPIVKSASTTPKAPLAPSRSTASLSAAMPTKFRKAAPDATRLEDEVTRLGKLNAQQQILVDQVEKERDFYFQKLREIEIMCQEVTVDEEHPGMKKFVDDVQAVLYKTEDGFEVSEIAESEAVSSIHKVSMGGLVGAVGGDETF